MASGFNGAASRRTRMRRASAAAANPSQRLQRSRVTTDADARLDVLVVGVRRNASTEPRHDGRGCAREPGAPRRGRSRFNGAASRRTRMLGRAALNAGRLQQASTEPRHDGRGCLLWRLSGSAIVNSFNGAASRRTRMRYIAATARAGHGRCFNGAASRRTRMLVRRELVIDVGAASTEPRHDGRGCSSFTATQR